MTAVAAQLAASLPRPAPSLLFQRQRPLFLGLSFGHPRGGVGSIGPFVRTSSGQTGILSISFLLAPKDAKIGDRIHQPGVTDAEILKGSTRIATLAKAVAPEPSKPAEVAAALALLPTDMETGGNVLPSVAGEDAGHAIAGVLEPAALAGGDEVAFIGCGSGYSRGRIRLPRMDGVHIDKFVFDGIVSVVGEDERFSCPGDIGALVYRCADYKAVGLVFASAEIEGNKPETYLLPLAPALKALEVALL